LTDEEVIKRGLACPKTGLLFRRLLAGDIRDFDTPKQAVQAFLRLLATPAAENISQISRIFAASELAHHEPRWDEVLDPMVHGFLGSYGQLLISEALNENARDDPSKALIGWDDPVPLGNKGTVPAFPLDCLPDWLRRWVEEASVALQTPPDLPALLTLGVAGAAVARKFEAVARDGWEEPLNLYVVVACPVGERKSKMVRLVTEHVHQLEQAENQQLRVAIHERETERGLAKKRLLHLEAKAVKCKTADDREAIKDEMLALAKDLEKLPEIPECRLLCDDETPEHLAKILAEQNGRMLQVSAEGTPFEIAKGRYSERANFDVYLKGHSGDYLSTGRIGREGEKVEHPALSMAVAVQPDVIAGLAERASLAARGFLARFLYAIPVSKVGSRDVAPPPITEDVSKGYNTVMSRLWHSGAAERLYRPKQIRFSAEADAVLRDFQAWIEPRLARGKELDDLAGWPTKLAGACVRLATILHCCECVGHEPPQNFGETEVAAGTVERAVKLCRDYLVPHAKAAMGLLGSNPLLEAARRVVGILRTWTEKTISRRDLHRQAGRLFRQATDLDPVLELLVEFAYLRPTSQILPYQVGRGHKSPEYQINPRLPAE
jgi:hypothetical protein